MWLVHFRVVKMKNETTVMKSDLINLTKAREFVSRMAREAGASDSAATKIEISSDEWNASIIEHALGSGVDKGFTIECKSSDKKFMAIYLQSKVMDIFQLPSFIKFLKRAMDVEGSMVLIKGSTKGETQEAAMVEEITGPDDSVFPLIFQCPRCEKKFKTSKPGKFRCSSCQVIIRVSESGEVKLV
ncbi:hypothetical protein ES703_30406 [subsurface metagenome]